MFVPGAQKLATAAEPRPGAAFNGVLRSARELQTSAPMAPLKQFQVLALQGVVALGRDQPRREAVTEPGSPKSGVGLDDAVRAGRLSPSAAARYRVILSEALVVLDRTPTTGRRRCARVLGDVAAHADVYDEPRALALFTMLEANADYLDAHPLPPAPTDIEGRDGIVFGSLLRAVFSFTPSRTSAD